MISFVPNKKGGFKIMSGEVYPCPFCGEEDLEMWPVEGVAQYVIECIRCKGSITGPSQLETMERWNRRDWEGLDEV